MPKPSSSNPWIPGLKDQVFFSQLTAHLQGERVRNEESTVNGLTICKYTIDKDEAGKPNQPFGFWIAARPNHDGSATYQAFGFLSLAPETEKSWEDSEKTARAVARSWHMEHYTFSHFDKPSRFARKTAVYGLDESRALRPVQGGTRWTLAYGPPIANPSASSRVLPAGDEWDQVCSEVEAGCETFHQIAALCHDPSFEGFFDNARRSIETSRAEARRLATMGQKLSAIVHPTDAIAASTEGTRNRLESIRLEVLDSVQMLSETQLKMPEVYPSIVTESLARDLEATYAEVTAQLTS
jgi:hypothetical protein